jgi:hypothetical protein
VATLFRLSGRKFAVLLLLIFTSDALVWFGKMTGGEWLAFNTLVFTGYIAANVIQKQTVEGKRPL